jgi:hypothetical protein
LIVEHFESFYQKTTGSKSGCSIVDRSKASRVIVEALQRLISSIGASARGCGPNGTQCEGAAGEGKEKTHVKAEQVHALYIKSA